MTPVRGTARKPVGAGMALSIGPPCIPYSGRAQANTRTRQARALSCQRRRSEINPASARILSPATRPVVLIKGDKLRQRHTQALGETRERLQAGGAMRELKTTDLARLDPFRAGSQLSLGEPCVFAKGANATSELLAYLVHLDSALNPSWWNSNSHTRW